MPAGLDIWNRDLQRAWLLASFSRASETKLTWVLVNPSFMRDVYKEQLRIPMDVLTLWFGCDALKTSIMMSMPYAVQQCQRYYISTKGQNAERKSWRGFPSLLGHKLATLYTSREEKGFCLPRQPLCIRLVSFNNAKKAGNVGDLESLFLFKDLKFCD